MAPKNVVEYFLWIGMAKYTKASPSARKMLLFSFIIITITLSYAIIRIYIVLHIYWQVSETERIAELHWLIGQIVLEKINQCTSTEYHLHSQECSFKNPNVLLRMRMLLISRLHKQPHYMKFKQINILYLNLHKKQTFEFSKRNSYLNSCLKLFCEIDNVTSYFLISRKNFLEFSLI